MQGKPRAIPRNKDEETKQRKDFESHQNIGWLLACCSVLLYTPKCRRGGGSCFQMHEATTRSFHLAQLMVPPPPAITRSLTLATATRRVPSRAKPYIWKREQSLHFGCLRFFSIICVHQTGEKHPLIRMRWLCRDPGASSHGYGGRII